MYINKIKVNEIRHLKDFEIDLGENKNHLILTGKNGSGKTTLLKEISDYLKKVRSKDILRLEQMKSNISIWKSNVDSLSKKERTPKDEMNYQNYLRWIKDDELNIKSLTKLEIDLNNLSLIMEKLNVNEFIIKMFETKRSSQMTRSQGVELIDLESLKSNIYDKQSWFLKYMVHLKTQLAYAVTDNDTKEIERIKSWFNRFEKLLKTIFETENVELIYDRKKYNFTIKQNDKEFDFNTLSDGFSAVLEIITGIMMGMEKEEEELHQYDMNGIVLIDELDTHLHISLQKKIFKLLTEFFPNIQFIITTHSPFILNSVENVVIYDLEKKILQKDMTQYTYDAISELYFGATSHSEILLEQVAKYEYLAKKEIKTSLEEKEFNELEVKFDNLITDVSEELAMKIWDIKGLK